MQTIQQLKDELAERLGAVDLRAVSPPIEIGVGDYSFYPYRGFTDLLERDDFRHLTKPQLRTLIKIADDLLAMRRPELFEAYVHDDGILVIDKEQGQIEYSMDVEYNDARSRIEEIHPQVTYPQALPGRKRVLHKFSRNDTVHEVTHHADFWIDMDDRRKELQYLHSGSMLLNWLQQLDCVLRPDGVANLIMSVREEEGYVAENLLREGYSPDKVDQMMRAEFFAIAGEFYYGSKQSHKEASPLLEAYMHYVLDLDLEIQTLYISFKEMEIRRKFVKNMISQPLDYLLGGDAERYYALRQAFDKSQMELTRKDVVQEIESILISQIKYASEAVRKKVKLPIIND